MQQNTEAMLIYALEEALTMGYQRKWYIKNYD